MSDDDYFTQSLETAMMKVATLGMEKEAMLKQIDDLEAALKWVVKTCEVYMPLHPRSGIELVAVVIKEQFAYLYTEPTDECEHLDYTDTLDGAVCNDCNLEVGGEDTQQDDDGYEPPEHMTADDFNEMHSGPYQPDDSGYMDGDE